LDNTPAFYGVKRWVRFAKKNLAVIRGEVISRLTKKRLSVGALNHYVEMRRPGIQWPQAFEISVAGHMPAFHSLLRRK